MFCKIKVIQSIFSEHNRIKLKISNKKIPRKSPHIWKLNNIKVYKVLQGKRKGKELSPAWRKENSDQRRQAGQGDG